ncbi:MBL fold metallo-hydrolase [Streptomyces sp. NPDC059467]|uniref:MBL fold metallo-hydrolase n=1 Tax=Streptomyces sp. NPDC059467 TaxID=3346844 RepID=UPI00368594E2
MTADTPLSIHVHTAPMRPIPSKPLGPGYEPRWSPCSSTLIAGERDAYLVDSLITHDQVDQLADWTEALGKRVVGILITHGHSDHWMGIARLQERFPGARGLATKDVFAHAQFEASDEGLQKYWHTVFPDGQIPDVPVPPELLETDSLDLEGHTISAIDIGQGDVEHSTVFHVPSLDAVAAGDVTYNQVHMMTAYTDTAAREAWIASLDAIAALGPRTVVSGHKRVDAPDAPDQIEQSKQYLRDFSRIADEQETTEGIVRAMLELHGDRDNPHTLWFSAAQTIAKRG